MSTIPALDSTQANPVDNGVRLNFSRNLQAVTNRIRATGNLDEIMLEVSKDICSLFNADHLIIYSISEDRNFLVSKVRTGPNSFRELKIPSRIKTSSASSVSARKPSTSRMFTTKVS